MAALWRLLAEDAPQVTEGELAARVLDIFSRVPLAMCLDLDGPLMAAKLGVFAAGVWIRWCLCHSYKPSRQSIHACSAAGIPRSEAPHKFGYLLKGLPRLAVRLPLIKAHGRPTRLNETGEVFCRLVAQEPADFRRRQAEYLGSEPWLQLWADHGLLSSGDLPADQRRGWRRRRAQPDAALGP